MKRFLSVALSALLIMGCLTACGVDKEALQAITVRLTDLDTKVSSMYGKIEDMHSTGRMNEDLYMEFMSFDEAINDALYKAEAVKPDVDELELITTDLESKFKSFENALEALGQSNSENLDRELLELKQACTELGELMGVAFANGVISQERLNEFYFTQDRVEKYLNLGDLEYSDKVGEDIAEIRSILSVMASEVNADNNLIDRLIDGSAFSYNGEEPVADAVQTQKKQPLSQDVQELITNYLGFQEFAMAAHTNGTIDDETINNVLSCGVQLTYLKEAVEQDGITENNTIRVNSIKADIYEQAVKLSYEKADLFK